MTASAWELSSGLAADLICGDPRWLPHPVSGIGRIAAAIENLFRRTAIPLRLAGAATWCAVLSITCGIVYASTLWLPAPYIQIYWIYSFLAVRSLDDHAIHVIRFLRAGDLEQARRAVAQIVGRDTAALDEHGITRAVVETVAENLNDGVIAPIFWFTLGGVTGMAAYKAINTMDSMFGYRNARYLEFGWCAARMDDLAGWIPARLTALMIWLVAAVWPGLHFRESWKATWRDARLQPSPNSGYPEAAAAGALRVQLGGVISYSGVEKTKALLGNNLRPLDHTIYTPMRVLLYASTVLFTALAIGALQWR